MSASFTNQTLINAFFAAGKSLNLADPWADLVQRAQLDWLAEDRNSLYRGVTITQLPNLSAAEKEAIQQWLDVLSPAAPDNRQDDHALLSPPAGTELQPAPDSAPLALTVASTWNRYGGLLAELADQLHIDPGVAVAVLMAESKGEPFGNDGRMVIRFENHLFYHYWGKSNSERFDQHFDYSRSPSESWKNHRWRPDANSEWRTFHGNQQAEWEVFTLARQLDESAAMKSISMGAPQIMGFNHQTIGYATVQEMFNEFRNSVKAQIESLFRFMQSHNVLDAVRNGDLRRFAEVYNGSGQAELYESIMRERLAIFQSLRGGVPMAMPRVIQPATIPLPSSLPMPTVPELPGGKPFRKEHPELYEAWRKHVENGLNNNNLMFKRILEGFMNPYWTTVWMYRILFAIGVGAFLVAAYLGIRDGATAGTVLFGGLSIATLIAYFVSRPLQALEENLQFITWLGVIYNTYWTRLLYTMDQESAHTQIEDATNDAIEKIKEMMDKHASHSDKRPGLR